MPPLLASFGNIFGIDGIIVFAIGLLIFGRRLPEVARNLWRIYDPRADVRPLIGLILFLAAILFAITVAGRFHR